MTKTFKRLKNIEKKIEFIENNLDKLNISKDKFEKTYKSIKFQLKDLNVSIFLIHSFLLKKRLKTRFEDINNKKIKFDTYLKKGLSEVEALKKITM